MRVKPITIDGPAEGFDRPAQRMRDERVDTLYVAVTSVSTRYK